MRFILALICLFILGVSSAEAGPIRNLIANRRAARDNCPCVNQVQVQSYYEYQWKTVQQQQPLPTNNCTTGNCPLPKVNVPQQMPMPKQIK
jgi:hypothetical protein